MKASLAPPSLERDESTLGMISRSVRRRHVRSGNPSTLPDFGVRDIGFPKPPIARGRARPQHSCGGSALPETVSSSRPRPGPMPRHETRAPCCVCHSTRTEISQAAPAAQRAGSIQVARTHRRRGLGGARRGLRAIASGRRGCNRSNSQSLARLVSSPCRHACN